MPSSKRWFFSSSSAGTTVTDSGLDSSPDGSDLDADSVTVIDDFDDGTLSEYSDETGVDGSVEHIHGHYIVEQVSVEWRLFVCYRCGEKHGSLRHYRYGECPNPDSEPDSGEFSVTR